jgi:hypothetical protein
VQEWLAPEGLNAAGRKRQRQEAAVAAAAAKAAAQDRKASEEAMQSALQGDMTWGMGPDAEAEDDAAETIDWRPRYDAGLLNPKQTKTAEAIRSKEYKMQVHPRAPVCADCCFVAKMVENPCYSAAHIIYSDLQLLLGHSGVQEMLTSETFLELNSDSSPAGESGH